MHNSIHNYLYYLKGKYPNGNVDYPEEKALLEDGEKDIIHLSTPSSLSYNSLNKVEFFDYCILKRGLKPITAEKYIHSLEVMKSLLELSLGTSLRYNIIDLADIPQLEYLIRYFETNNNLVAQNLYWHHIISAAYNNFLRFLKYKYNKNANSIEKLALKKHIVYFNIQKKILGRKATNSNLHPTASDNSLYFGLLDQPLVCDLISQVLSLSNILDFNGHNYVMDAYGLKINVYTRINSQGQLQIMLKGNTTMHEIYMQYVLKMKQNLDKNKTIFLIDFLHNIITLEGVENVDK
ncbi:MAG: hypothetical protein KKE16_02785 [Firmicutes bacterium]|nr:hypothetical protein [Bacillota bacterium]